MASLFPEGGRLHTGFGDIEWPHSLEDFGEHLAQVMDLAPFEHDAENVYEWGQTLTASSQIEVNITRKHGGFHPPPGPISVILVVSRDAPAEWTDEWVTEHLLPHYAKASAEILDNLSRP